MKDFLTLVKLCNSNIDYNDASVKPLLAVWNEPSIETCDVPDLQDLRDPKFVDFINVLWNVQGHLQNASFLWSQRKIKAPMISQEGVSFDFE